MKSCALLIALSATYLMVGCADPSDTVPKSTVSQPQSTTPTNTPVAGQNYIIGGDSTIGFVGSKVTGSHTGGFKKFSGAFKVDGGKIVGSPEVTIDMTSTWSDNDKLSGHLKSADFFGVDQHPQSKFVATSIEPSAGGNPHKVTGNLTLHGVTKSISFPADIKVDKDNVALQAQFAINRKDFNINYPGKQDDLIRDNVVLRLNIKASPSFATASN